LTNFVNVDSPVGTATASNAISINKYKAQAQNYSTLHNNVTELNDFSKYIVSRYADPEYRISQITVSLNTYFNNIASDPYFMALKMVNADLADLCTVKFQPPGSGSYIEQGSGEIVGISHAITPSRHDVTVTLVKKVYSNWIILDSRASHLDTDVLAF